jgi:transposase
VPALPPYILEPIWAQFEALLPEHETDHPLGCHRRRIPDRVVFEKLVQVLVFGCAYWRIADEGCSATTLRRRRDEWIEERTMYALREMVLGAYDRLIGLVLGDLAVDGCIAKAPCGGEKAGKSPVDRGNRGIKRSTVVDACGIRLRHPPRSHHRSGQPSRLAVVGRDLGHPGSVGSAARSAKRASRPRLRLGRHSREA